MDKLKKRRNQPIKKPPGVDDLISRYLLFVGITKAKALVKDAGVHVPPVSIEHLAGRKRVLRIEQRPINTDGLLKYYQDHYVIVVNSKLPPTTRNFTIAHELAHILISESTLGRKLTGTPILDQRSSDLSTPFQIRKEKICDRIAGELLMPQDIFTREAQIRTPTIKAIQELAGRFRVSPEAVLMRLYHTRLWNCVAIVWRFTVRPGSNEKKLRVDWGVSLGNHNYYIPKYKPAPPESSIMDTFLTGRYNRQKNEYLELGNLKGWYCVESARFGKDSHPFVVSLLV